MQGVYRRLVTSVYIFRNLYHGEVGGLLKQLFRFMQHISNKVEVFNK